MKLCGFVQVYNEVERGNLHRCLRNLRAYCDDIAVYDDGSTDNSAAVARAMGCHVLRGDRNDHTQETLHKQRLLDFIGERIAPDYVFWLDADEVLDADGTAGGVRALCDGGPHSFDFEEVTLWRSHLWRRMDYLGRGRFCRLWRCDQPLRIPPAIGLHRQLYPNGLQIKPAPFKVLHFGYATREAIERRWIERTRLGVPKHIRARGIDESRMVLEPVPREWFPPGVEVPRREPMPTPIEYSVS